jgi:hypothetical protein
VQGKHFECERELQRHQDSYMRREEQLQARLAELEQRLNQATPQEDAHSAAADADAAADEADSGRLASEQHRSSNHRGPSKAQPLTLEVVQHQVGCWEPLAMAFTAPLVVLFDGGCSGVRMCWC